MFDNLIGESTPWTSIEYNWRDMALYALAVGADENDLQYTYEKGMKALPSFGVLPVFNNINIVPRRPDVYSGFFLARDLMSKEMGVPLKSGLHMWHELEMYRSFDPIKGTMQFQQRISKLYNWGEKGTVIELEIPVFDESGQPVCMNRSLCSMPTGNVYQGDPLRNTRVPVPDIPPDMTVESYVSKTQNVLYRLTGDTTPTHVDPEECKKYSDKVFMQGLCSFGFACRMAIKAVIPGEPERLKRLAAQMRSVMYPDTKLELQLWKQNETSAWFRMINKDTKAKVLDNGVIEWA